MIKRLKKWLEDRYSVTESSELEDFRRTVVRPFPRPKIPVAAKPAVNAIEDEPSLDGKIEDLGPGKNVLIRNKYLWEDTGTHETLKILDDSLVDTGEEEGIDPYNTGGFDRSKNWHNRFRK